MSALSGSADSASHGPTGVKLTSTVHGPVTGAVV